MFKSFHGYKIFPCSLRMYTILAIFWLYSLFSPMLYINLSNLLFGFLVSSGIEFTSNKRDFTFWS